MVSLGQYLLSFGSSQVFVRFLPFFAVDDFTEALGGPFLGFWKSLAEFWSIFGLSFGSMFGGFCS